MKVSKFNQSNFSIKI